MKGIADRRAEESVQTVDLRAGQNFDELALRIHESVILTKGANTAQQ